MAIYANDMSLGPHRSQQPQVEKGAALREQQDIFRLPDLTKMQVKVAVHESKVEQLRAGMRARIRVQDREFQGSVVSVASQPEPTHFFSSNVSSPLRKPRFLPFQSRHSARLRAGGEGQADRVWRCGRTISVATA